MTVNEATAISSASTRSTKFHLILERDVGLFSLIQQVVAHVPVALAHHRVPVAVFGPGCVYWTTNGYEGASNVWEYYFEPVAAGFPVSSLPAEVLQTISSHPPSWESPGVDTPAGDFVSAHFGDHPDLAPDAIRIPYLWDDPTVELRRDVAPIIERHVRPRPFITERVDEFLNRPISSGPLIGVHARGTDAVGRGERRLHRRGSMHLPTFVRVIRRQLKRHPGAAIFVATDDERTLAALRREFPNDIVSLDSIRHAQSGDATGAGPGGWIMPSYISGDRDRAAQNGAEAVIEYLILSRCRHLVHNGSGLARTALLANPNLEHTNAHLSRRLMVLYYRNLERVRERAKKLYRKRAV